MTKRKETQGIDANWHVALRPGKRKSLDKSTPLGAVVDKLEHVKASIRAKVEHPFRVSKRQFGHVKVRYRGLAKNTAQLHTRFALSNLWMVRRTLLQEARGLVRPKRPERPPTGRKQALKWPESRRVCRHLKHRASAPIAASVVQTILRANQSALICRSLMIAA